MTDRFRFLAAPSFALVLVVGCGDAPTTTDSGPITPDASASADPAAGAATPAIDVTQVTLSAEQMEAIKKLPEADQALALEQKVCPSSGENLGAMDVPIKIDVKGQAVFLCCKGCLDDAEKNPDTMLAKLGKQAAGSEAPAAEEPATP